MVRRCIARARVARTDRTIEMIVRRSRSLSVVVVAFASSACYATAVQPVSASMVERRAEFVINDEGRVSLRNQLGQGAGKVEGRVVAQDDSGWTLRVYRLTTISGESFAWGGESVQLPRRSVQAVASRDFDRRATLIVAAGVTGAVAAFVWSRGLFGGGLEITDPNPNPGEVSIRF